MSFELDFKIGTFSGAYIFHVLWIYPPVVIAAAAALLGASNGLARERRLALGALTAFFGAIVLLELESGHLPYFNFRYTVYAYPILLLAAWAFVAHLREAGSRKFFGVAIGLSIVLGGYYNFYWTWETGLRNPVRPILADIFAKRNEIRDIARQKQIIIDRGSCNIYRYNAISGILLRKVIFKNLMASEIFAPEDLVVVCKHNKRLEEGRIIYRAGDMDFYAFP